jgi:hypothetical protein
LAHRIRGKDVVAGIDETDQQIFGAADLAVDFDRESRLNCVGRLNAATTFAAAGHC